MEIARIVGEGITTARLEQPPAAREGERVHTFQVKRKNLENFDGKTTTTFNQWWELVMMYLGFYLETNNRQKIAWVGTLLTDTALAYHLHCYCELNDADTWVNYVVAIRANYHNE